MAQMIENHVPALQSAFAGNRLAAPITVLERKGQEHRGLDIKRDTEHEVEVPHQKGDPKPQSE